MNKFNNGFFFLHFHSVFQNLSMNVNVCLFFFLFQLQFSKLFSKNALILERNIYTIWTKVENVCEFFLYFFFHIFQHKNRTDEILVSISHIELFQLKLFQIGLAINWNVLNVCEFVDLGRAFCSIYYCGIV